MSLLKDVRYAARGIVRARGFATVAVFTLALAIGANAAIFSVVNGLLLKPLPFPEADRVMQLQRTSQGEISPTVAVPKLVYWRDHGGELFSSLAAFDTLASGFNLSGDGPPERLVGYHVTRDFLTVFGVAPMRGRDFLAEEDRPGARRVLILSFDLWRRRFGGDETLVGRPIVLNGEPYTVVGVMPPTFRFPATAEMWTPLGLDVTSQEKPNYLEVAARLRPGVERAQAQARMSAVDHQYNAEHPAENVDPAETVTVMTVQEHLYGHLRPALFLLLASVLSVLLIACVNIANLQMARAAARQREIALRTVLGARAGQIFRQLLTESLLLSLLGGAAGLALGYAALPPLLAQSPVVTSPSLTPVGMDGRVLLFVLVLSLGAGVLFGLVPALTAARGNLNEPLKEGTARSSGGVKGARTRRFLVVTEVALALVLIIVAALLVRSFTGLVSTDAGFVPDHVLTMKLSLPEARYGSAAAIERFLDQSVERIEGLPGVKEAAAATTLPLELGPSLSFTIEGRYRGIKTEGAANGVAETQYRAVSPHLFKALGIPVRQGRAFTAADRNGGAPVALVNEAAARRYWPGQSPVGQRITVGQPFVPEMADPAPRTVVGVVGDVHEVGLDEPVPVLVYVPIGQMTPPLATLFVKLLPMSIVVHTASDPGRIANAAEREIWAVDPQQPVTNVTPMSQIVDKSLGARRFNALLLGVLAVVALVLAAVGIYGVLSYLVGQRTREIGIRMAIGATSKDVLRMVLWQGLGSVLLGVAIGLALALLATYLLKGLLYGVSTTDPLTFFGVPLVLAAVAAVASAVPAFRASRLDPLKALAQK